MNIGRSQHERRIIEKPCNLDSSAVHPRCAPKILIRTISQGSSMAMLTICKNVEHGRSESNSSVDFHHHCSMPVPQIPEEAFIAFEKDDYSPAASGQQDQASAMPESSFYPPLQSLLPESYSTEMTPQEIAKQSETAESDITDKQTEARCEYRGGETPQKHVKKVRFSEHVECKYIEDGEVPQSSAASETATSMPKKARTPPKSSLRRSSSQPQLAQASTAQPQSRHSWLSEQARPISRTGLFRTLSYPAPTAQLKSNYSWLNTQPRPIYGVPFTRTQPRAYSRPMFLSRATTLLQSSHTQQSTQRPAYSKPKEK